MKRKIASYVWTAMELCFLIFVTNYNLFLAICMLSALTSAQWAFWDFKGKADRYRFRQLVSLMFVLTLVMWVSYFRWEVAVSIVLLFLVIDIIYVFVFWWDVRSFAKGGEFYDESSAGDSEN